jgi:AcrR family transcriptional regulator
VYNYYRTKEDLLFDRLDAFGDALAAAVRDRPAGRPIVAAFSGFLLARPGLLGSPEPADAARLVAVNRLISESPALRARERQVYDDHTRRLAAVLADEAHAEPDDPRPWVAAHALIGAHRALVDYVRAEVLAGRGGAALVDRVRSRADRAFAVLDAGLASYPA